MYYLAENDNPEGFVLEPVGDEAKRHPWDETGEVTAKNYTHHLRHLVFWFWVEWISRELQIKRMFKMSEIF